MTSHDERDCGSAVASEEELDWWAGGDRAGAVELVATVALTVALQPFLQALASKAGEDVWTRLAGLVRGDRRRAEQEAQLIDVRCDDDRLVIRIPRKLSGVAMESLADRLKVLPPSPDWRRLAYDAATRTWNLTRTEPPTEDASAPDTGAQV
jgi:hypothetical protein